MAAHGIELPPGADLAKAFTRYYRFAPAGTKGGKKAGWARLHEHRGAAGQVYISGAYGVFSGSRNDSYVVEAAVADWSPAERAASLELRKAAERAAAAERAKDAETAADKARRFWKRAREIHDGAAHAYLQRKQVGAFGVRVFYNDRLVVPLRDLQGALHGLQYIAPDGAKLFGTGTVKEGRSHLIGDVREGVPLCFGEGYATCASAHMATGWPVVVCFDAGNLGPVMAGYRKLYEAAEFLVLADDDRHLLQRLVERLAKLGIACTVAELRDGLKKGVLQLDWQIPDGPSVELSAGWRNDAAGVARIEGTLTVNGQAAELVVENAGQAKAHAAAKKHHAKVITPFFADRDSPHTDWNDLHVSAGLDSVREQLQAGHTAPAAKPRADARAQRGGGKGRGEDAAPGGDADLSERFTLIYGTTTVWDALERRIVRLEAIKAAFGVRRVEAWLASLDRRMVSEANVVFDPTGKCKPPDYVNLFDRYPLELPAPPGASCSLIVEHIFNLCQQNDAIFNWVMCWLAYPLQNPGAKMRTALVLHGRTEGTGKSKLGEVMRRLYGRYATSVGQAELQRDFNDWISAKVFVIGEEVVSRQDRVHLQGALQALITQPTVQINTKNMPIREERNHANFLFLSNQQVPVIINPRDRRYTVIKIEQTHPPEYFEAIDRELDNGGAEAFLQYLLDYDVGPFNEYTRPIETRDRTHLITLGMGPDQRFVEYWRSGHAGVPYCCAPAGDLYAAFKAWCRLSGERFVPNATAFGRTVSEELERIQAPPKRVKRYVAFSDKQVSEGDWSGDPGPRQGIVYFVPHAVELLDGPRQEADEKAADTVPLDVTESSVMNDRIRKFQHGLHDLIASARRGL